VNDQVPTATSNLAFPHTSKKPRRVRLHPLARIKPGCEGFVVQIDGVTERVGRRQRQPFVVGVRGPAQEGKEDGG